MEFKCSLTNSPDLLTIPHCLPCQVPKALEPESPEKNTDAPFTTELREWWAAELQGGCLKGGGWV